MLGALDHSQTGIVLGRAAHPALQQPVHLADAGDSEQFLRQIRETQRAVCALRMRQPVEQHRQSRTVGNIDAAAIHLQLARTGRMEGVQTLLPRVPRRLEPCSTVIACR